MNAVLVHVGGFVLLVMLLLLGIALRSVWCKNVFRAGDKLVSAIFGFDGYHTLSAQCGAVTSGVWLRVGIVIDMFFGDGHCEKAARQEGLLV